MNSKQKYLVVHVETESKYDKLMQLFESKGIYWSSGEKPTAKSIWHNYNESTCVRVDGDSKLQYSPKFFYTGAGYNVISFEEYVMKERGQIIAKNINSRIVEALKNVRK
jgi:hypothetical protein